MNTDTSAYGLWPLVIINLACSTQVAAYVASYTCYRLTVTGSSIPAS